MLVPLGPESSKHTTLSLLMKAKLHIKVSLVAPKVPGEQRAWRKLLVQSIPKALSIAPACWAPCGLLVRRLLYGLLFTP